MVSTRSNAPVSVQGFLSLRDGTLSRLCAQAGEISRLDRILATLLPAPLSRHVRACAIHDGTLVLQTDSPVWSTRLRLEQHRLLSQLRESCGPASLAAIHVTVAVPAAVSERPRRRPRLSKAAAQTLAQCAESQTDPALRASLTRLSRRA